MITHIIEATNRQQNWGKFLLMRPDAEWSRTSKMSSEAGPLLRSLGWDNTHIWVLDLQTGEGAFFRPGGIAKRDLDKHKIWVCPLFEPFLEWLYKQNLSDLTRLPESIDLPEAEFLWRGHRRLGPETFFQLTANHQAIVAAWSQEQDQAAQAVQLASEDPTLRELAKDGAYHGAAAGALTYAFTPTALGEVVRVTHAVTKNHLDLTSYEEL